MREQHKNITGKNSGSSSALSDVIIQTKHVDKYFYDPEKFKVLSDINIQLKRAEFCSIMGASGSGKSTLLYLLSTLDTDYEGEIWIDDTNLKTLSKNQLAELRNERIGFVFQFHYLLPEFTVLENVKLPALKLARYSDAEIEQKALEKLDILGLRDQALKRANKLSGGQQQRVAIARALINDPEIIFGDEPTGNLDSKNAQMVTGILKELKQELKQTILVVTHDNNFAASTERIIVFKDGEVVEDKYNS
ncbi:MAG TPA: ABC transporter ATP-binding protein [Panacibacter sp.]|nr:ABC transporter ATP-binding protein [Panacibacter sp.]HNP42714.1 ABC transporter ATP-binding protein [Panacibacter sp.]